VEVPFASERTAEQAVRESQPHRREGQLRVAKRKLNDERSELALD